MGFHIATYPGLAPPSHPGGNGRGTRGLQLVPALGTRSPTQHCLLNTHCAWDSGPSHYLSNKKIWMLTTLALCSRDLVNSVLALERCCPRPCPILPTLRSVALVTGSLPLPKCLMLAPSPSPCLQKPTLLSTGLPPTPPNNHCLQSTYCVQALFLTFTHQNHWVLLSSPIYR